MASLAKQVHQCITKRDILIVMFVPSYTTTLVISGLENTKLTYHFTSLHQKYLKNIIRSCRDTASLIDTIKVLAQKNPLFVLPIRVFPRNFKHKREKFSSTIFNIIFRANLALYLD